MYGILWSVFFLLLAFLPDEKILRYKWLGIQSALWAIALFYFFKLLSGKKNFRKKTPLDLPLAVYALSSVAFYFLSPQKSISQAELLRTLTAASAFFLASQTISMEMLSGLKALWAATATGAGLYGIWQIKSLDRPFSTFGNPIFFAAYILASICLTFQLFHEAQSKKSKYSWALCLLLQCLALGLTQTRASLLALTTVALLVLWQKYGARHRIFGTYPPTLLFFGAFLGLLGLFAAVLKTRPLTHWLIWKDSLRLWLENPWLGCGLGRFHVEFPRFASQALQSLWPQDKIIVNYAHNELLQVLAETGILGLGVLLWVLSRFLTNRPHTSDQSGTFGFYYAALALWIQNLFSVDMRFGVSYVLAFACMGIWSSQKASSWEISLSLNARMFLLPALLALQGLWAHQILSPYQALKALQAEPKFFETGSRDLEAKIQELEERLSQGVQEAGVYEALGYFYSKTQNWPMAISRFQIAIQLNPSNAAAYNNLGNIQYTLGNREEAIALWKKSVEVSPYQADAHLNLGLTLYQMGRLPEAAQHLQTVLELDPSNEKAKILLKKMVE